MKGLRKWLLLVASIAVLAAASLLLLKRDRMFHGQTETAWIESISDRRSLPKDKQEEQLKRWQDFGPEAYAVLYRGFDTARHGCTRRKFHQQLSNLLPAAILRLLPKPPRDDGRRTRLRILDLLSALQRDEQHVLPIALLALRDESPTVRVRAINLFLRSFDGPPLLTSLSPAGKNAVLPYFLSDSRNTAKMPSLACSAISALSFYPEQAPAVIPLFKSALKDPSPELRMAAATALNRIDEATARNVDAIAVVIRVLESAAPADSPKYAFVAHQSALSAQAAFHLRQFAHQPDRAIDALISALQSPDVNVACNAIWSLQFGFGEHVNKFKPALRQAASRNDGAGQHAWTALVSLETREPSRSHTETLLQ